MSYQWGNKPYNYYFVVDFPFIGITVQFVFLYDSFNPAKDLTFMPVSGLGGLGLLDQLNESVCPWYRGPAFIPFIDELPSVNRNQEGPFIMPIVDKYKDMGTVVMGKVESGQCKKGQNLLVMPNRTQVSVDQLWSDDFEVTGVSSGENIKCKLKVSYSKPNT